MGLKENKYYLAMQVPQIGFAGSPGKCRLLSSSYVEETASASSKVQENLRVQYFSVSPTHVPVACFRVPFPVGMLTLVEEMIKAVHSVSFAALPPLLLNLGWNVSTDGLHPHEMRLFLKGAVEALWFLQHALSS